MVLVGTNAPNTQILLVATPTYGGMRGGRLALYSLGNRLWKNDSVKIVESLSFQRLETRCSVFVLFAVNSQQHTNGERIVKPLVIERQWTSMTADRSCGACAECCTWLGIEELKKWTGQTCKHLDGRRPEARCKIYESRPEACVAYFCMWRAGFGPAELQPHLSGLLITPYQRLDKGSGGGPESAAVTILITDEKKAETLQHTVVMELIMLGVTEIRLINPKSKKAMLYKDGEIFRCRILPAKTYEELVFETDGVAIARYEMRDRTELENDQTTE